MWFKKISIPSIESYLKFHGGGGLEVQISKGYGGEKSNIFPEGPRALSEGNLAFNGRF